MQYHRNAVFVLEAHPIDPRILISGGHDGHIVLWDILSGKRLKVFFFEVRIAACVVCATIVVWSYAYL